MKRTGRKKEWAVALFCASILFLFPPILSTYDKQAFVFGMPVSYVVLYGLWGLIIVAIAYGARRNIKNKDHTNIDTALKSDHGEF
ncbi:MAG: hypothetical protein HON65_03385 [Rhodospirillales bacterium]|jgi:hypothetical protein|nr:hypothetical protein [Rhodospirillales bacterium]